MPSELKLRKATESDQNSIKNLLSNKARVHRHLDWRNPLDWIGYHPYWLIEKGGTIQAALACPDDPPGIVWIRFFSVSPSLPLNQAWCLLFASCLKTFSSPPQIIASVAIHDWYARLLLENGFTFHQNIIVLEWRNQTFDFKPLLHNMRMREMNVSDLEEVAVLDQIAFNALWQNSQEALEIALKQSSYAVVAIIDTKIIGYQISSSTPINAHLSRLAVRPDLQGLGIGYSLTDDMIQHFTRRGIGYITVNTQHDNHASLALYDKLGFKRTRDIFPVFRYSPEN